MEIYTGLGKKKSNGDKLIEALVYLGIFMGMAVLLFVIKSIGLGLGLV